MTSLVQQPTRNDYTSGVDQSSTLPNDANYHNNLARKNINNNQTYNANNQPYNGVYNHMKLRMRSPPLFVLSSIGFTCFFGWLIVEIIMASVSDWSAAFSVLETSQQLFMYASILATSALASCWYADFRRTRASRAAAVTVTTFTAFAFMYELWYIIPAFRNSSDASNYYCNGQLAPNSSNKWCSLARSAAGFAVGFEFTVFLCWVWALITWFAARIPEIPMPTSTTILAPRHSMIDASQSGAHGGDVDWRTELTEPDDLELIKIAAGTPHLHNTTMRYIRINSLFTQLLTTTSLIGWIILTCSLIPLAMDYGLNAYETLPNNTLRLGSPMVSANWYWLTISLGVTLAISSYAAHRRNRGVVGAAWLFSIISSLQWFSLFIYAARRVNQQSANTNQPMSDLGTDTNAQYAEVAGIGLIAVSEFLRALVLLSRYHHYLRITRLQHDRVHIPSHVDQPTVVIAETDNFNNNYNNAYNGSTLGSHHDGVHNDQYATNVNNNSLANTQEMNVPGPSYDATDSEYYTPSYLMGMFHGSTWGFRALVILQAASLIAFFIVQLVAESYEGLFSSLDTTPNFNVPSNQDRAYYFSEIQFLLTTFLVLISYSVAFYAEREVSVASASASMHTSLMAILGFFLLVWPYAYESIYSNGTLYAMARNGPEHVWRLTQAAGILSIINAFCILALFTHSVHRLASRKAQINVWERGAHAIPTALSFLIIAGFAVWAFCTLYFGLFTSGVMAQMQALPGFVDVTVYNGNGGAGGTGSGSGSGSGTGTGSGNANYPTGSTPIQAYFAAMAFLAFATTTVATAVGIYASRLMYAWQSSSWRAASFFTAMIPTAFFVPFIIVASRFLYSDINYQNSNGLSNAELALAAGIIILMLATVFFFASFFFLVFTQYLAAGPTGAAAGTTLVKHPNYVATQRDIEAGVVTDTTYGVNKQTAINPRTGDVVVVNETRPIQQTQIVTAPVATTVVQQNPAGIVQAQQYQQQQAVSSTTYPTTTQHTTTTTPVYQDVPVATTGSTTQYQY